MEKIIVHEIKEEFKIQQPIEENLSEEHHSLAVGLPRSAIEWLGSGSSYYVGTSEGEIAFYVAGGGYHRENTTLVSGGDGTTTYLKVTATYTATEATTINTVKLTGTKASRTNTLFFSTEAVSQVLANGQSYTINWILHADI